MDLNKNIEKHTDTILNNYHIEPYFDESSEKVFYTKDGIITFNVDEMLYEKNGGRTVFGLSERFNEFKNHKKGYYFNDLKYLKEIEELKEQGFNDLEIKILFYIKAPEFKENHHSFLRNSFNKAIIKNDYSMKVRVELVSTLEALEKTVSLIGSKTGVRPQVMKGENESYVYLKFKTNNKKLTGRPFSYQDILDDAEQGTFNFGLTENGDYKLKIPRGDSPLFMALGGLSRSGKSTLATRFITTVLNLYSNVLDEKVYDYEHVFLASAKVRDDYMTLGWREKGMFLTDNPYEILAMLDLILELSKQRIDSFEKVKARNIKEYNKRSDIKMGKVLVVMDEYVNTLKSAAAEGSLKIKGKTTTLDKEIEKKLSKINTETGSRGFSTITITQNFKKGGDGLGDIADTVSTRVFGSAKNDVWNSIDKSQSISKYIDTELKGSRQGIFFVDAPEFPQVEPLGTFEEIGGFVETRTHYHLDSNMTEFDRTFETNNMYLKEIQRRARELEFGEDYEESETIVEEDIILENNNIENTIENEKDKERNESDIMEFLLD